MKAWKNSRNPVALFALGTMLSLPLVERARAFTQVESQFLPAVQLVASQLAQVSVVNFSAASVAVTIDIFNGAGNVVVTKTVSVGAGRTYGVRFQNGKTTASYSAIVSAGAASSVVSDFQVLGANGAGVATSFPILELPAVQHIGSARLAPGQSAAVAITNVSTVPASFTVEVFNNVGTIVVTQQGTIDAAQTLTFPFSNTEKTTVGYRAVVSTSATNTLTPDLLTFDAATGHLINILPPGPCRIDPY